MGGSKLYLFWLCVSDNTTFNTGHCEMGGWDSRRKRIRVVATVIGHSDPLASLNYFLYLLRHGECCESGNAEEEEFAAYHCASVAHLSAFPNEVLVNFHYTVW